MTSSTVFQRLLALGLLASVSSQCTSPIEVDCSSEPIELDGFATGYESCGEFRHRASVESCPVFEHAAPAECADVSKDDDPRCNSDVDCDDDTFGRCLPNGQFGCGCVYGCASDDDCEEGAICLCGEPFGTCVQATCKTDADCEHEGSLCADGATTLCGEVPIIEFACFVPQDECHIDLDCDEPGARCVLGRDRVRTCQLPEACAVPEPAE